MKDALNLNYNTYERSHLHVFLSFMDVVVAISFVLEILFYFDGKNIFGAFVLAYGWFLIRSINLTQDNLCRAPVSFVMMLGLALFYYALPMPLTILDGRPVSYNLRIPYSTFSHHAAFVTVIALTHAMYSQFIGEKNFLKPVLAKFDFYRQPSDIEIWTTALLGLLSGFYSYFIMGNWQIEAVDRGFGYHVGALMAQFIWMPVMLLFPRFRGLSVRSKLANPSYIIAYSFLVFIVAIASNWRTVLFSGIMLFLAIALLSWLHNHYKVKNYLSTKSLLFLFAIIYVVSGPFMDMARAMVDVRGSRVNISAMELLSDTILAYKNGRQVNLNSGDIPEETLLGSYEWNEDYISNIAINRFVSLKISDNSLFYAEEIGALNNEMLVDFGQQIFAMLPSFLLKIMDLDINKKFDVAYSIGDYLYVLASGNTNFLGSSVISSMPGVGMSLFGYWYILVLVPLFLAIFFLYDSLAICIKNNVYYSYYFVASMVGILNYFNDRHVYVFEARFILRNYWESIILFMITMWVIRSIINLLKLNAIKND